MALSDFPRYPLTFGPSPVHRLERLSAEYTIADCEDCLGGACSSTDDFVVIGAQQIVSRRLLI